LTLKLLQSSLYILIVSILALVLRLSRDVELLYCDDSMPFYGYLLKVLSGKVVIIRLGDLQTGYLFDKQSYSLLYEIAHALERYTWKKVDGIVAISKAFLAYIERCGIAREKVIVVPESVDTYLFSPRTAVTRSSSPRFRLMYHGVIEPQKGLDRVLAYVEEFRKRNNDFEFLVVGDGSARKSLTRQFSTLVSSGKVRFTGWKPLREIIDLINGSDVGVVYRKPVFANNLVATAGMLQYMACAKPVIVPDLTAMKDLVATAKCGAIYRADSALAFGDSLETLMNDELLRAQMGKNGRSFAQENLSTQVIGTELGAAVLELAERAMSRFTS